MLIKTCGLVALVCFVSLIVNSKQEEEGKQWALLVAGSKGYANYRHQADVCHAYHVVRNHGIPAEQIVLMMYDDVANSTENPYKGTLINEPGGPNVYEGVAKDYTGDDVSPEVFYKVLAGDSAGVERLVGRKGKVINSGPNDRIFVYFADHGGMSFIAFPNGHLFATRLAFNLADMYAKKQFKQMVLYIETCQAASMFFNGILPTNISVFATTSSGPFESAYACYFDKERKTYLADCYSSYWMDDSDRSDLRTETLEEQFLRVQKKTNRSRVDEWGDKSLAQLPVGDFQGNRSDNALRFRPTFRSHHDDVMADAVKSEDVAMEILKRTNDRDGLENLVRQRDATFRFFQDLLNVVSDNDYWTLREMPVYVSNFKCYEESIDELKTRCPGMDISQNDYAIRSINILAHLCEMDLKVENIAKAIRSVSKISPLCE